MKILIIAEWFHPASEIAAIRSTKLYKYWKRAGHCVNVITMHKHFVKLDSTVNTIDETDIFRMDSKTWLDKHYAKYKDQAQSPTTHQTSAKRENVVKKFIKIKIARHYFAGRQKSWRKNCQKLIRSMNFEYDVVFSTFGPTTTLKLGMFIKRRYPHLKWIADFRDQPDRKYHTGSPMLFKSRWIKRICGKADLITCVSEGVVTGARIPQKVRHKTRVISNGFDRDDINCVTLLNKPDKFNVLYTGTIYEKKDDFCPLFKALAELINEEKICVDKICVEYAGRQFAFLDEHAKKYGMQEILKNHGFVSRCDALKLQSECSLLFVACWNNVGAEGILTGKVFEYLMQGKPILALVSGNLKNSSLKELLLETNSGFTYEEANDVEDFALLKNYILKQYNHFIYNEPLEYKPNIDNIEKYNWKNLAQEFSDAIGLASEKKNGNIQNENSYHSGRKSVICGSSNHIKRTS